MTPSRVAARPAQYTSANSRLRRTNGSTMSLAIIFDSASESTTIIAVAAENPPRKTIDRHDPRPVRERQRRG